MIDGVKVVELVTHEDDRGYLTEVARHAENPEPHAVVHRFGQVYLVGNPARGTIRAFHKHEELWDWFFISHGSAKFVLKDDRAGEPDVREPDDGHRERPEAPAHRRASRRVPRMDVPRGRHADGEHRQPRLQPREARRGADPPDAFGDVWTVKGR